MAELLNRVKAARREAAEILEAVKEQQETISVAEAKRLISALRETEGWLMSARRHLGDD